MSKAEILGSIRHGLSRQSPSAAQRHQCEAHMATHRPSRIPDRAQRPHDGQVHMFIDMAREAAAEVIEVTPPMTLAAAVTQWLGDHRIDRLVMEADESLEALDWQSLGALRPERRVGRVGDPASLTTAFAGIAETGTLLLYSRPQSPTTLNFLPDCHLVVLDRAGVVGTYEDAWGRLRAATGGRLPRTVNLITGPSRSADIEQKLQLGAHGPRKLIIFLV